jgi:exodeoxyribonuclease VII small subunit
LNQKPGQPEESPLDFEKAVEQIEAIIDRIESGEVGLEKSIGEYERGVGLLKRCRAALAKAEQRVEELTAQMQAEAGTAEKKSPSASPGTGEDPDEETPF